MSAPQPDDIYISPAGAEVRVDRVTSDHVYFMVWDVGEETGVPKRMTPSLFATTMEMHGMVRK